MQRFVAKRKMSSEHSDIFYSYLMFGGVDAGPNMFQGLSQHDMKDMDAEDIAIAMTRIRISSDKDDIGKDTAKWVVDFEGVARGFLYVPLPYPFHPVQPYLA